MFKNVNYQLSTINRVLGFGIKRFVCFDGQRDVNWELRTDPEGRGKMEDGRTITITKNEIQPPSRGRKSKELETKLE